MLENSVGLRTASKAWIDSRFEANHQAALEPNESIEVSPFWRLLVFAFTLAQSLKLLACTGIPWTHAWSYMFIISFLVQELLLRLSYTVEAPGLDLENQLLRGIPALSGAKNFARMHSPIKPNNGVVFTIYIVPFIFTLWLLVRPLIHVRTDDTASFRDIALFAYPSVALSTISTFMVYPLWFIDLFLRTDLHSRFINWVWNDNTFKNFAERFWTVVLTVILTFMSPIVVSLVVESVAIPRQAKGFVRSIILFLGIVKPGQMRPLPIDGDEEHRTDGERKKRHIYFFRLCILPSLFGFVLILLWYATKYDSKGTYRPHWTDKLG
jgi:hypothetical protein